MAFRLNTLPNSIRARGLPSNTRDRPSPLPIIAALILGLMISASLAVTATQFDMGPLIVVAMVLAVPAALLLIRYPFLSIMLWMLIFPFVVRGVSGFAVPIYWTLHRFVIPGALWLVILRDWAGGRKKESVRFGIPEFVMALSLLWAMGSVLLFNNNKLKTLVSVYDELFVPYCAYCFIRLYAPTEKDLRRFLPVAFFTIMTQSVIGIISWVDPHMLPRQWLNDAGARIDGTFDNPAVFTSTILFLALIFFQYGIHSKSKVFRLLAILTLGFTFFMTFVSLSRGSWLGALFVGIGLLILYPRVLIPPTVIAAVVALLLGATVFRGEVDVFYQRLTTASTAEDRVSTGARSLLMFSEKPILGWGFGNYDRFKDGFLVNTILDVKESDNTSHNTYLTILAEQGFPAVIFYLFPTAYWLLASLTAWRRMPRGGLWSLTFFIMLWLLVLDHITVSSFMDMIRFNLFGTTVYWMLLGLVSNMAAPYLPDRKTAPVPVKYAEREESRLDAKPV